MSPRDKEAAVDAMFEGILAAYHAVAHEHNSPFDDCRTFAQHLSLCYPLDLRLSG